MSRKPRFARRCLAALLLLALVALPASALGKRLDPLVKADELIQAQKYNEAKTYLAEFMRKYPERFDEALKKIREIEKLQNEYNQKSTELLATMQKEPGNDEKILGLIGEIEKIKRDPNPKDKETITKLKETRLVVKNQDIMRRIMTQARAQIDQGRYAEAARTYEQGLASPDYGGLALFEEDFRNAGYDQFTVSAVTKLVAEAKAALPEYEALQAGAESAVAALSRAYASGDPAQVGAALPAAEEAMTAFARSRLAAYRSGEGLSIWAEKIPTEGKSVLDYSMMTYANLFIRGRPESLRSVESEKDKPEGIVGAMLTHWVGLMGRLQEAAEPAVDKAFAAAEAAYDSGERTRAKAAFQVAAGLAAPALRTLGLWSLLSPTDIEPGLTDWGRKVLVEKAVAYERIRHLGQAADSGSRLAEVAAAAEATDAKAQAFVDALAPDAALSSVLASLDSYRSEMKGLESRLEAERSGSAARAEELGRWVLAGLGDERSTKAQGALDGRLAAAAEEARGYEVAIVSRAAGVEYARLEAEYGSRVAASERARALLEGQGSEDPALAGTILRYPTRSAQLLAEEEGALRSLRAKAAAYMEKLRGEIPFVASAASVTIWTEKAGLLDEGARSLQSTRTTLLTRAQDQKRQAEANRLRADELFSQASASLKREDFDGAKRSLDESGKKYLASLSLEDDQALRSNSGRELERLGAEIVRAENDKVIRDTRALINQGKEAYFAGSFDKAESALIRGRERWRTTHNDDLKTEGVDEGKNTEVEYWLALVQTAITVKTGRDIPQTAPLYPEMSQTLSLAHKFYDEGSRLLARKDKSGALLAFSQAKAKINEVRLVYPLNQDAGILSLRIDQLIDPDSFRQGFSQRLAAARTKIRAARDNPVAAREAYADLQNLAAIDSKYTGIKALIEEAEYALGLRLPPPDPAKIKRAKDLVTAARRIYEAGDTGRFSFALEQLNQALENDPNNQSAADLKDRIQTFQGGSAQLVLTAAAESQYQQAISLFQSGNYLGASAIVERLLLDPRNKRVQKLIDLYNQIKARI